MHPNQDNVVPFGSNYPVSGLPPQNIEAEEAILGGIMLDPEAMTRVTRISHQPRKKRSLKMLKWLHGKHFSIFKR